MIPIKTVTAIPAYGRDYKSKAAVLTDWESGRDFKLSDFNFGDAYFSRAEADLLKQRGATHLHIRYSRLEKIAVIQL